MPARRKFVDAEASRPDIAAHAIDLQRYLTHLLTNLPATRLSDLNHWLPDAWKQRATPSPIKECG